MTDRRAFIGAIVLGVLPVVRAYAQQRLDRTYRIGYLSAGARPDDGAVPAALRQALQDLGYRDGKNVTYVGRWAEARRERLPALAMELAALKLDLIITAGSVGAVAAKQASSTIPIVMTLSGDPVGVGLIASLGRPGGNVTGITDDATSLSAKRLQLLHEVMPSVSRVAVLWNAEDVAMTLRYREIDEAARALRISVQPLGVREPDDFDQAFAAMDRDRPDALFMVTDSLTSLNRKHVLDFAATHRIPAMYEYAPLVREGGLISYGPSFEDMFQRAAAYVDRILNGAKPSELPVEQPTRYYLVINLRTAKALGMTIPQPLLLRADEVIR